MCRHPSVRGGDQGFSSVSSIPQTIVVFSVPAIRENQGSIFVEPTRKNAPIINAPSSASISIATHPTGSSRRGDNCRAQTATVWRTLENSCIVQGMVIMTHLRQGVVDQAPGLIWSRLYWQRSSNLSAAELLCPPSLSRFCNNRRLSATARHNADSRCCATPVVRPAVFCWLRSRKLS